MVKKCGDVFNNLTANMKSSNNSENSNTFDNSHHTSSNSNNNVNQQEDYSAPEIDINMIMKMKTIMDSMKNNKNDPRANLLKSLKPYLNKNRKDKVDQYIQLFNMSKVFEVMNPLGGDSKNDV